MTETTNEQIKLLLNKGVIKVGSILALDNDVNNEYRVESIGTSSFGVTNIDTHEKQIVAFNRISSVEEMSIKRIIQAYSVDDELNMIDYSDEIDIENEIFGKEEYTLNGIELEDDMKVILHNNKNPKYNDKVLTVHGVGTKIKLSIPRGRPKKQ